MSEDPFDFVVSASSRRRQPVRRAPKHNWLRIIAVTGVIVIVLPLCVLYFVGQSINESRRKTADQYRRAQEVGMGSNDEDWRLFPGPGIAS